MGMTNFFGYLQKVLCMVQFSNDEFITSFELVSDTGEKRTTLTQIAIDSETAQPITVRFVFSQYNVDTFVNVIPPEATTLEPESVLISAGALKFRVWLAGWPFQAEDNSLRLELDLVVGATPGESTELVETIVSSGTSQTYHALTSEITTRFDMLDFCVVDAGELSEARSPVITSTLQNSNQSNLYHLTFDFPWFSNSLRYDPQIDVLLDLDGSESSQNNGNSNELGIILGALGGVLCCFAILAIIIIITLALFGVLVAKRKRQRILRLTQQRLASSESLCERNDFQGL